MFNVIKRMAIMPHNPVQLCISSSKWQPEYLTNTSIWLGLEDISGNGWQSCAAPFQWHDDCASGARHCHALMRCSICSQLTRAEVHAPHYCSSSAGNVRGTVILMFGCLLDRSRPRKPGLPSRAKVSSRQRASSFPSVAPSGPTTVGQLLEILQHRLAPKSAMMTMQYLRSLHRNSSVRMRY